jgi:DNA helicase-2/ATP-dependent DNA helicase PcrA
MNKILNELNLSQKNAVTFKGRHLLVLAGAGTGKTKTIISRAAYLISEGVNPNKIQILTFTKRSANEIISRINISLNKKDANLVNGATFHSWCNQLINRFPNLFGTKSFTVIDSDDQLSIMKIICGNKSINFDNLKIKPQALLDLYSFARNTKRNLTETLRFKLFNNIKNNEIDEKISTIKIKIEDILKNYELKKKDRRYLDYDDIIQVVANRIKLDKQARDLISSQFEHILVDEMQDTNPLQWDLLEPFQNICKLYCVGDDAQSIYAFRGADFKNVHLFKERVKESEIYKLEDNYRSTQEILDISNWLLSNSTINYNKKLNSMRGSGKTPLIMNISSPWDEARWISDKILENNNNYNKLFNDHLVLTRSSMYTITLEAVFIEKKIPYVKFGGRKFMESAHIKDLISALRIVNNIDDEIAWIRFLTLWEGIGEIKAVKYINELLTFNTIEDCIVWLNSIHRNDENKIIPQILKYISENSKDLQKAVKGASDLMEKKLSEKYKEDWDNKRKPDFNVLSVLANNYSSLGEFITECLLDSTATLSSSIISETDKEKDKVTISTIHSAKGLEADTCFVVNVSPKIFPTVMTLGNIDEIEEDRRLLYVALTRAKNDLIITRNINSINGDSLKNLIIENEIDNTNDIQNVKDESNIIDYYFLNGLTNELAFQSVIDIQKREVKDLDSSNTMNIDYGMDFS